MWDEIARYLPRYASAVVTAADASGYPFSLRCRPALDAAQQRLTLDLPPGMLLPGRASLLCHSHNEQLWNLQSFMLRGRLALEGGVWHFTPERFVPGAGVGGGLGLLRFVRSGRRNAARYLRKRGLKRPHIPWRDIQALKQ